jgi:hypothetical protein
MVHVDSASGALCVGDERRRVSLDLDTGTAALELERGPVAVRALRWREKVTLARYAALGPRFVEAQFLRACAGDGHAGEPERELLLDVARWLNAPAGGGALPFDADELARALVGVCGALGLRPAELDARPAAEVEMLWQVIRAGPPGAEPAPAGGDAPDAWTRIVVRPDPPDADGAHDRPAAVPADVPVAAAVPAPADAAAAGAVAATVPQRAGVRVRLAASAQRPLTATAAPAPAVPAAASPTHSSSPAQATPQPHDAPHASSAPQPLAVRQSHSAPQPQAQPQPLSRATPQARPGSPPQSLPQPAPQPHAISQPPPPSAPPARTLVPRGVDAPADGVARVPQPGDAARLRPNGAVPAAPFAADARTVSPEALAARMPAWFGAPPDVRERDTEREPVDDRVAALDVDALVAALSERFEEAAAEIGIAPWD